MKTLAALWLSLFALAAQAVNYVGITVPSTAAVTVTVNWNGTLSDGTNTCVNSTQRTITTCNWTASIGAKTITATGVAANSSSSVHGTGSGFGAWGGTACNGQSAGGTCTFTLSGATDLSGTFYPKDNDVWWVATGGSGGNNGLTPSTAFATWAQAVAVMTAGDTVYFNDGIFNDSIGGSTAFATNIVSGTSSKSSRVYAYNANAATIEGSYVRLPLNGWHVSYFEVQYMRFMHSSAEPCAFDGSSGSNTNFNVHDIVFSNNACAYALPGQIDASALNCQKCDTVTFANNWTWGYGTRYGVALYRSINSVARQNVSRYDGSPAGNPKASMVAYDVDVSIFENNLSLDFSIGSESGDTYSGFFSTSSSPQSDYPFGLASVSWFGNIAYNTVGGPGVMFDSLISTLTGPSGTTKATASYVDNVVAAGNNSGDNAWYFGHDDAGDGAHRGGNHIVNFQHNTVYGVNMGSSGRALRMDNYPWVSLTLSNNIIDGGSFTAQGCYDQQSAVATTSANNLRFACDNALYSALPNSTASDPLFSATSPNNYIEWVQQGPAFGTGAGGSNIGATVVKQYVNGTLTGTNLWPFANQANIRADLCSTPDGASSQTINATSLTSTQNGNVYFVTTAGTTNWTLIGAAANTVGTKFTKSGATGAGTGVATPSIFTRSHNTSGLCGASQTVTEYIWTESGNASPW